ncbi:hypothetical protein J7643_14780 [bacterium]|nr:hypothetical protein [bacterium]
MSTAIQHAPVTPAFASPLPATLALHVTFDGELDTRSERFFEGVERLIFAKDHSGLHKARILRRYARMLLTSRERRLAELAWQLAETYEATTRQFR